MSRVKNFENKSSAQRKKKVEPSNLCLELKIKIDFAKASQSK